MNRKYDLLLGKKCILRIYRVLLRISPSISQKIIHESYFDYCRQKLMKYFKR